MKCSGCLPAQTHCTITFLSEKLQTVLCEISWLNSFLKHVCLCNGTFKKHCASGIMSSDPVEEAVNKISWLTVRCIPVDRESQCLWTLSVSSMCEVNTCNQYCSFQPVMAVNVILMFSSPEYCAAKGLYVHAQMCSFMCNSVSAPMKVCVCLCVVPCVYLYVCVCVCVHSHGENKTPLIHRAHTVSQAAA